MRWMYWVAIFEEREENEPSSSTLAKLYRHSSSVSLTRAHPALPSTTNWVAVRYDRQTQAVVARLCLFGASMLMMLFLELALGTKLFVGKDKWVT